MITDGGLLYSQIDSQLPEFVQTNHTNFTKFIEKYYEFLELNLITFTDLDLNEDSILQETANTVYTVTVATGNNAYSNSANKFYIDGNVSPTLTLTTGSFAVFDQGAESNDGHYLRISTTPNGIHSPDGQEYVIDDRNDTLVTYEGTPGDLDNIVLETGTNGGGILLYEDEVEIGYEVNARVIFYVSPDLAGQTLYYYCNNHSGMGGSITVSNVTTYMVLDNGNTESSNTSTDQINLESPIRQGDQFLSGEIILGSNSGATGIVAGKYQNTQIYIEETNDGAFQVGESIKGKTSRATANISSYSRQPINASRNVKAFQDVDKAPAGFVELFRKEFLPSIKTDTLANKNKILKNIKDFYRAKGNEASFQYIFRLLYGKEDVQFYYPSNDILRLSDGRWQLDKSLKINTEQANNIGSFLGKIVQGQTTNVSALVERTETYQVGATSITELFLSGFDANNAAINANTGSQYTTFNVNEILKTTIADSNGNFAQANTTGILQSIDIGFGGSNYTIGDEVQVTGGGGVGAKAKVASVADASLSAIDIIDSGDGYAVGDSITFVNEGTGGTGASARVDSIVKTANVFIQTEIINTFKNDTLDAAAFSTPWTDFTRNNHISSNSTTTFTVPFDGLSGSTPKIGDFVAKFGSGESITLYTPGTSKFATVVSTNSTSITYALGSIDHQTTFSASPTLNNFENNDEVTIFDLTKNSSGTAANANGDNAVFRATGATFDINGTPTANTDSTYHGAATFTEKEIGGIRSIRILSSGQGYVTKPAVTVANSIIEALGNAPEKVGANSVFVTLANTIANTFVPNTEIKNSGNTARGIVLDFIDSNTSLVSTGNTVLRVQMTTANSFAPNDILTSFSRAGVATGIGDIGTANVSADGTTATFTQADHGFEFGDRIVVTGSESGTDAAVYNNNHTIVDVANSSSYTVTFGSDPTDNSESGLTVRRIVTANVAYERLLTEDSTTTQISFENGVGTANDDYSTSTSNGFIIVESGIDESNVVFANTGLAGNNAVVEVASIAVGAIEALTIFDFGAGYITTPTINASSTGDGNATLTGNIGAYAEYQGYYATENGLLSSTNKMQDNFYYQDFSYVIKTDIDVRTYRDKILELVHPAGMALFGEVAITSNLSITLFDGGSSNINSTQANTALVANSVGVERYMTHEIQINTINTTSTNNQITSTEHGTEIEMFLPILEGEIDAKLDTTGASTDFDLQLEHGHDLFSLEISNNIITFENSGEILLEQDIGGGVGDRLIEETVDFLITEDGESIIFDIAFEGSVSNLLEKTFLQLEESDGTGFPTRTDIISHFVLEDDDAPQSIELEGNEAGDLIFELGGRVLYEQQDAPKTIQVLSEDGNENFQVEEFISALELEDGTDGDQEDSSLQSFFLFENDDADARGFLLIEPETITSRFSSERETSPFNIILEEPGTLFKILQEGDPINPDDVGDNILLEDVGTSDSSYVGTISTEGLLMGFTKSDSPPDHLIFEKVKFVTDTNIKGETYREGSGFFIPSLLFPLAESGSALLDLSFTSRIVMDIDDIQNVRLESDGGDLHYEDDGKILYEQQETTSTGYQYDFILLEESDGTNPVYIATENSMTEEIDTLRKLQIISDGDYKLELEQEGTGEGGFLLYENGGIQLESATSSGTGDNLVLEDEDRLLLEDGQEDKVNLVQPSVAASVKMNQSLLDTGDTFNEGSFLFSGNGVVSLSSPSGAFELLTESGDKYITEQNFGSDDDPDNLISEEYSRTRTATGVVGATASGVATQFEFDFNNLIVLEAEKGVIILEQNTPEENSIILETNDSDVFGLLQQEDGSKIFTEEDIHQLIPAPERLCHVGLHDLILEEEGILQEASDQIKLEDFTLDNIVQEDFTVGQFVPFLGFGDEADDSITLDDNMLFEEATHRTENFVVQLESGDLLAQEEDGVSHIVLDDFYFKNWSEGQITQSGTTITLSGSTFPSAVVNNGRLFYDGGQESTDIISLSVNQLELTVERSVSISSAENYRVGYELDDTPRDTDAFIVIEAFSVNAASEVIRNELFINGLTRGEDTDGLGTLTLNVAGFTGVVGNDIVYEDGARILAEDGIGGYIAFEDLGNAHGRVLNEDDSGGFIATEDFEAQTDQDDNVIMKEQSDGILLESSETEVPHFLLNEDGGQMMLEEVFQVSEYKILLDSNDSILIENQPDGDNFNYRLLNLDMSRFDIATIANNTFMEIEYSASETDTSSWFERDSSSILISRTEQIV